MPAPASSVPARSAQRAKQARAPKFGRGFGRRRVVQHVEAEREAGPAQGRDVVGRGGRSDRLFGKGAGLRRVHVQQVPGPPGPAQLSGEGRASGRHAPHYPGASALRFP
jgi:hypothetical protein